MLGRGVGRAGGRDVLPLTSPPAIDSVWGLLKQWDPGGVLWHSAGSVVRNHPGLRHLRGTSNCVWAANPAQAGGPSSENW